MTEKDKDIGALWIKRSNNGEYMTGYVEVNGEKLNIVCFLNGHKKEAKHPDWRILKSKPKEEEQPENRLPEREDLAPEDVPF